MKAKVPSESRTVMTDMVLPSETNPLNNLFGGELLARIDFGDITNCAFDKNEKYLYATGFISNPKIFRLKLKD